jgi:hypothetical protein
MFKKFEIVPDILAAEPAKCGEMKVKQMASGVCAVVMCGLI